MTEEKLNKATEEITKQIKIALIQKGITQVDLARVLDVNPPQLNRAIKGDPTPKSKYIRRKIYHFLGIE